MSGKKHAMAVMIDKDLVGIVHNDHGAVAIIYSNLPSGERMLVRAVVCTLPEDSDEIIDLADEVSDAAAKLGVSLPPGEDIEQRAIFLGGKEDFSLYLPKAELTINFCQQGKPDTDIPPQTMGWQPAEANCSICGKKLCGHLQTKPGQPNAKEMMRIVEEGIREAAKKFIGSALSSDCDSDDDDSALPEANANGDIFPPTEENLGFAEHENKIKTYGGMGITADRIKCGEVKPFTPGVSNLPRFVELPNHVDIFDMFDVNIEYPGNEQKLGGVPQGTLFEYVPDDYLYAFVNQVDVLYAVMVERYAPLTAEKIAWVRSILSDSAHFYISGPKGDGQPFDFDDIILLGKSEDSYWLFWFDGDVSDCMIGRFPLAKIGGDDEQLYLLLQRWLQKQQEAREHKEHAELRAKSPMREGEYIDDITGNFTLLDHPRGWITR